MIKTVTLSGAERMVSGLGGFNTVVHNLGVEAIYASKYPGIIPGADNVAEVPAGSAKLISTTNGTVHVFGRGKAELTGQDHDRINIKLPPLSAGGSGSSDVNKAYVDTMDEAVLDDARAYTDAAKESMEQKLSEASDRIADNAGTISELREQKADKSDIPTSLPADGGNADTVNGHTVNADVPADAKFTDTTYSDMVGATEIKAGEAGLVPAPPAGNVQSYLRSDGCWSEPPGSASNPNLLDNWYFADPVNQRGLTAQTGGGSIVYGIDRWGFYGNSHPVLSILDDCIEIDNTLDATENTCGLVQRLESRSLEAGRVYTLSVLAEILQDQSSGNNSLFALSDGTDKSRIASSTFLPRGANGKFEVFTHTFTLPEAENDLYNFRLRSSAGSGKIKLKAMKLELGNSQTLAHKEGGEWVLNDPAPNKAMELAKCQRYYVIYDEAVMASGWTANAALNYDMYVDLPVPLRAAPTASMTGYVCRLPSGYSRHTPNNAYTEPTGLHVGEFTQNRIRLRDTIRAAVDGNNLPAVYSIRGLEIDANL